MSDPASMTTASRLCTRDPLPPVVSGGRGSRVHGYPKKRKCCCWIWLRPRYKIPEFFSAIAPVLTSTLTVCRRNRGNPSTLYSTYDALQVLQKYSCSGLAWIRPRADRGLSWPTRLSVFRTTICMCKILSRSVEIWQYEGQKHILVKTEHGQAYA